MNREELDEMIVRLETERTLLEQAIDAFEKYRGISVGQSDDDNSEVQLLSARETADMLRIDLMTVYNLARNGRLPCIRQARTVRFRKSDVEKFGHDRSRAS